jgi:transcriptional regulator with XRE-family HTH domain
MLFELKARRVELGLSQKKVARKFGISTKWLSMIENGYVKPPVLLDKLLKYYLKELERHTS